MVVVGLVAVVVEHLHRQFHQMRVQVVVVEAHLQMGVGEDVLPLKMVLTVGEQQGVEMPLIEEA